MNSHSPRQRGGSGGSRGGKRPTENGRATAKRERILDAAVKIFAQEGFYNAKVSQIAQEAGVADGTIYLYFKSKDDLLISLFEDRMERINANVREALASTPNALERLKRLIRLQIELVESNRHMAEVISIELRQSSKFMKEYANPKFAEFLRLIAGAVAEGQRAGDLRDDIDPPIFARALFGALDELTIAWLAKGKQKMDLSRAAEQLGSVFIDGLRARPHERSRP